MSNFSVRDSFLPYALPTVGDEEIAELIDTVRSNWLSKGPKTTQFEKQFAEYVGARYAVATNSCTAALHLALAAKGIGKGDEVITTPFTFAASVNVILHVGATPVFVDIDPDTYTIDAAKIEEKITDRTKALIPVHYAGQSCDMDQILRIASDKGVFILEDAAHAVHTKYRDKMIGGIGDATAFSFYATKNICTGEGGMLTTNDEAFADKARVMSLHGMSRNAWNRYSKQGNWYYEILMPGFKYNMTDMQAALGIQQLLKINAMQETRERYAQMYNEAFSKNEDIVTPFVAEYGRHAWHLYVVQVKFENLNINRDEFIERLAQMNIGTSVHFIPVHLHPYYRETFNYKKGDYPVTEGVYEQIVSLPLYPRMSPEEIQYVIDAVNHLINEHRNR